MCPATTNPGLSLTELRPLNALEVEDVRRLASDLPALWEADTTTPVDRKCLSRSSPGADAAADA